MEVKEYDYIKDPITGKEFKKITRPYVKGTEICAGCVLDEKADKFDLENVYVRMCNLQICPHNDKIFTEI